MRGGMTVSSINSQTISDNGFIELAEVEKEMWAYGIGEYVKCNNCGKIHSKEDIFGHLSSDIRTESVTQLEEILGWDSIKCRVCSSDTEFIYDVELYSREIKSRLCDSVESYIVLLQDNEAGKIRGFMDGYIDNFLNIFHRELKDHYKELGPDLIIEYIEGKIKRKIPEYFFSFSSMGTQEKYRSFFSVFELIKTFFNSIPDINNDVLGITELDTGSNLHGFHHSMGILKLGLQEDPRIANKSASYNSDLYVQPGVVKEYKDKYNLSVREFLKHNRDMMRQVLH